jgi:hypothetical protein
MNEQFKDYYIQTLTTAFNDILYKNFSMQTELRISNEMFENLKQQVSLMEKKHNEYIDSLTQEYDKKLKNQNYKISDLETKLEEMNNLVKYYDKIIPQINKKSKEI